MKMAMQSHLTALCVCFPVTLALIVGAAGTAEAQLGNSSRTLQSIGDSIQFTPAHARANRYAVAGSNYAGAVTIENTYAGSASPAVTPGGLTDVIDYETEEYFEDEYAHPHAADYGDGLIGGCDGSCDGGCDASCGGVCTDAACGGACGLPCPLIPWYRMQVFGGVHGFTGPANRGQTASFGFHEGFNLGLPLTCLGAQHLGFQFGLRGTHSNFSGTTLNQDAGRDQLFLTSGLFRRCDAGFQLGVVVDYLSESWYYDGDIVQLRGEIGWLTPGAHEVGFWWTSSTQTESIASIIDSVTGPLNEEGEPVDLFAFFYRCHIDCGEGRLFLGWTGNSDGLIGGDLLVPLTSNVALETGFTYLIPDEGQSSVGVATESWNVFSSLVWYPGCQNICSRSYYRPLLDVADNGSFILNRN